MIKNLLKTTSVILIIVLFLTSCAKPIQLRDRAIIQVMGIDYEDDKYKVTFHQYLPTENEEKPKKNDGEFVVSQGKTIFEAIKNAQSSDGNQIFYGQCRLYILGKSVLEKGVGQITEFMNSNYQLSLASNVLAADTSAEKIVKTKLFNSVSPDISVKRIEGQGKTVNTTVIDTLKDLYNLKGTVCLPQISLKDEENAVIENAVVLEDYKSSLFLDADETIGLCFIRGKIADAVMTAKADDFVISVGVVSQTTKIKLKVQNSDITLKITVNAKGNISESGVISSKSINAKHIKTIQNDIQKQIKNKVDAALEKIIADGECDLLYLFNQFKKKDKTLYEKYKDNTNWLKDIKFETDVNFKVRHSGIGIN